MPLLLWGLQEGIREEDLRQDWPGWRQQLLQQSGIPALSLIQALDRVRDRWIEEDLQGWLGLHRFYPGGGGLATPGSGCRGAALGHPQHQRGDGSSSSSWVEKGSNCRATAFWARRCAPPKATTLQRLLAAAQLPAEELWFVEDRLQTLRQVQTVPELEQVLLFLADWGYNLPEEREEVARDPRLRLLSLEQLCQPFDRWIASPPPPRLSISPASWEDLSQTRPPLAGNARKLVWPLWC
jgi:hypothetical protein